MKRTDAGCTETARNDRDFGFHGRVQPPGDTGRVPETDQGLVLAYEDGAETVDEVGDGQEQEEGTQPEG